MSNKLLVENLLASILRINSLSAHYIVLYTENMDGTIVKAHAPVIDIKVGALP